VTSDPRALLQLLKDELSFLEAGGYRLPGWKPPLVFEDSPSCIMHGSGRCGEAGCLLLRFVPPEHQSASVPCRHIVLKESGETVDSLYNSGTTEELEDALRDWLHVRLKELEARKP